METFFDFKVSITKINIYLHLINKTIESRKYFKVGSFSEWYHFQKRHPVPRHGVSLLEKLDSVVSKMHSFAIGRSRVGARDNSAKGETKRSNREYNKKHETRTNR